MGEEREGRGGGEGEERRKMRGGRGGGEDEVGSRRR